MHWVWEWFMNSIRRTKMLVLFPSVIPVRHTVDRKAVQFSAMSQARNPKFQSQLCHYLVVLPWKSCVPVFDFCFPIWKTEIAMPAYTPSQDGHEVQYRFSVLKGFWNVKSSKKIESFSPHIQKKKTAWEGIIGCKINVSWPPGCSHDICPRVRLVLSLLVWRHEPGIKSSGCREHCSVTGRAF